MIEVLYFSQMLK